MSGQPSQLKRLVLFDIDGTLISCGPQVRPFFRDAIEETFGTVGEFAGYSFAGKTDPQIVTDLMRGAGVSREEIAAGLPQVEEGYLERLSAGLDRERMVLHPGVVELLEELTERADIAVGLLTGNWERGGRIKLSRFDLNRFFDFGAFGDGQFHRLDLPAIAIAGAVRTVGRRFTPSETLLIGDSRLDVACGRANRIPLLAVSTGPHSADELRAAGAENVVPTLADPSLYGHLLG
jgi:phosphoglycolate phosphatase-like HAD superfamily hydrolase